MRWFRDQGFEDGAVLTVMRAEAAGTAVVRFFVGPYSCHKYIS